MQPQSHATYDPRTVGTAVWAHRWVVLAVVTIVVLGGMFLSFRQTPIYQSTAQVVVPRPVAGVAQGGQVAFGSVSLEDEAQIATGADIASQVKQQMGFDGPASALSNMVRVGPSKGTATVLLFEAQNPDPRRAADLANAFAKVYVDGKNTTIENGVSDKLDSLKEELKADNKRLARMDPLKQATEYAQVSAEAANLQAQVRDYTSALEQVRTEAGKVLNEATPASAPVKPSHPKDFAMALIAGIVLAVILAMFLESIDRKLRGTEDVETQTGGSVLGAIPHFPVSKRGIGRRLVVMDDPRSPAAEAYRTLRTGLLFAAQEQGLRSLAITSSEKGEGKSTTSSNLALAMALAGERVLLVDGDLRRPSVHSVMGLPNEEGLAEVLTGRATSISAIQKSQVPRLRVLTCGKIPPNPAELLGSSAMQNFLTEASEVFDWILIDAPPVLGVADASVIARQVGGVLFVVSEGTTRDAVAHARDQLSKVNTNIVGTALNNLTKASRSYYPGYGYYRYYGYRSRQKDNVMDEVESSEAMDSVTPGDPT